MSMEPPTPGSAAPGSAEERPSPTTSARAIAAEVGGLGEQAFAALVREPSTGVGVLSIDGQVLYLNAQAARIFHGPDARPEHFVGRYWRDHLPASWVDERIKILREIAAHGQPVRMRTIWRGYQHVTWISPIEAAEGENAAPLFLTITRREAGDEEAEPLTVDAERCIDSEVMRLGALDALSRRELEVMALVGQGLTTSETARVLCRSEKTVEAHVTAIHRKLGVHDRVQMSEIARRAGLSLADAERRRV